MRSPGLAGATALAVLAVLAAGLRCGRARHRAEPGRHLVLHVGQPTTTPAAEETEEALPDAVSVADAGGETLDAGPDNDFAIAAAGGIWVTGVPPGLVRYEAATGEVTHRVEVESAVVQALDAAGGRVWVVGLDPDVLLVVDDTSGEVVQRVALPADPLVESSLGASGDVAWVLVDPVERRILRIDTGTGRDHPAADSRRRRRRCGTATGRCGSRRTTPSSGWTRGPVAARTCSRPRTDRAS